MDKELTIVFYMLAPEALSCAARMAVIAPILSDRNFAMSCIEVFTGEKRIEIVQNKTFGISEDIRVQLENELGVKVSTKKLGA